MELPLNKFLELPARDKARAVIIGWNLLWIRLRLNHVTIASLLPTRQAGIKDEVAAAHIGTLVEQVAGHTPWYNSCLVRAIVCARELDRTCINHELWVGTRLDDGFQSHAWVEVGNRVVCGASVRADYEPLTVLSRDTSGCTTNLIPSAQRFR